MSKETKSFQGKACAKINLFLYVTGKRPDNYHDIYTLFVPINIFDKITLTPSDRTELFCSDEGIPCDDRNIILKTDAILRKDYGLRSHFSINLEKGIPHGAGLGGGSSDGAKYMVMVNDIEDLGLSYYQMVDIMGKVGSDTVFFIDPKPALARGRGEILEPYDGLPPMYFIIIYPHIQISTKKVYENNNLVLTDLALTPNLKSRISFESLATIMKNDLESPLFNMNSEIKDLVLDIRKRSNGYALMSGSGSCVFAVYDDEIKRDTMFEDFKKIYSRYLMYKAEVIRSL